MSKDYPIAVLISGRGSNLAALIEQCSPANTDAPIARIVCVLSDKADAQGLKYATEHGIPTLIVQRLVKERSSAEFNRDMIAALKPFAPELIVLAGFMRIIDGQFLDAFEGKVVNIHPSLLPAHKGATAQADALNEGVSQTGCTAHFVCEDVDSGPIIGQSTVPVFPDDTVESLSLRILAEEHLLLPAAIAAIARNEIRLSNSEPRTILWSEESKTGSLKPFRKP